jgi:hypothetical protein
MLALFVAHCLRSDNPFFDPALFRIGDFTRATLTMAPFSTAFGGFLLSLVLWEEGAWHWSAMKIGLAIAPGPFMVPVTSLLFARSASLSASPSSSPWSVPPDRRRHTWRRFVSPGG